MSLDSIIQDIGTIASTITGIVGVVLAIRQASHQSPPSPSQKNTLLF